MEFDTIILIYLVLGSAVGSVFASEYEAKGFSKLTWILAGINLWPLLILSDYFTEISKK